MGALTSSELLLAIDIGNTNVVLGIYQGERLSHHWRLATSVSRTSDEAWIVLRALCQGEDVRPDRIKGVAISPVVPDITSVFWNLAREHFSVEPYEVRAETAPSLKIHYRDPSAVGADRIRNAIAGFQKHGGPPFAPALAERWELSPDGLELGFHLRPDARWSDGRPITARDVEFTHRAQLAAEVAWPYADSKRVIESLRVVDPQTVVFRLRAPGPYRIVDVRRTTGQHEGHRLYGSVPAKGYRHHWIGAEPLCKSFTVSIGVLNWIF